MNITSNISLILPLAIEWAHEKSREIEVNGVALTKAGTDVALRIGVSNPEKVRILEVTHIPKPDNPILNEAAIRMGLLGSNMIGLTLGYSIYICSGNLTNRVLSHELRHVHQYETHQSIDSFLIEYLTQIFSYGYTNSPLEIDARNHEIKHQYQ